MFWMDTDPEIFLESAARVCARSKYSPAEIETIFWNEVRPAVKFNLATAVPGWTGFETGWLTQRILKKNRFGRRLPLKALHPDTSRWWKRLRAEIETARQQGLGDQPGRVAGDH